MKVSTVVQSTGEVIELEVDSPEHIQSAWLMASDLEKAAKAIKEQLKPLVDPLLNERGTSDEINGFVFRQYTTQRTTYDKAVLREVIADEDMVDLLLVPDKKKVRKYIKDHLTELGDGSTRLRDTMIAEGVPFSTTKLERVV